MQSIVTVTIPLIQHGRGVLDRFIDHQVQQQREEFVRACADRCVEIMEERQGDVLRRDEEGRYYSEMAFAVARAVG